ncbi:hypothetical protein QYE76_009656 [Lolium multiflorum]|uniref:Uncharacterized protein n=1 Tax=Lolium multiflorum TaxID=4521 RepID=A0AAD8X3S7_LOLMU|nr:hypothetical protein QYE76_009656 [Lolium multiflorum]
MSSSSSSSTMSWMTTFVDGTASTKEPPQGRQWPPPSPSRAPPWPRRAQPRVPPWRQRFWPWPPPAAHMLLTLSVRVNERPAASASATSALRLPVQLLGLKGFSGELLLIECLRRAELGEVRIIRVNLADHPKNGAHVWLCSVMDGC